ncbi:glycine cleavage system protein R [Limisalsivibrio acetivorans]|uniref:glycine cleavage system protein R n=1 Tax=Limisalsivibrio acetivorans TaxID=1304888 RepID=UPI0003B2F396|nr:ACT domain-containing protein [Limisalsivibrio acetivorans]
MGKKNLYSLMLVAGDRPGIVAEVTDVMVKNSFNIEDSSSTLLKGFFAAIFIVSHDEDLPVERVKSMYADMERRMDVSVQVQDINDAPGSPDGDNFIISVYGSDKPGIVNKVAGYLSDKGINIADLQTKVAGKDEAPIYIMVLEVVVPEAVQGEDWTGDLKKISEELGTDIHVRQIETYEL